MKSFIAAYFLLSAYCYGEPLLGGWSVSNDESFNQNCLQTALVHIHGKNLQDDIKSKVSELACKTQIVNGLNIKCSFILSGQKWMCSYYKSFIKTLETQLEQCKVVDDDQTAQENQNELVLEEQDDEVDLNESMKLNGAGKSANEMENDDEELVQTSTALNDVEEDDEAKIDEIYQRISEKTANNNEEEQQDNENDDEA